MTIVEGTEEIQLQTRTVELDDQISALGWALAVICLLTSYYLSLRARRIRDPRQQTPGKTPWLCRVLCCGFSGPCCGTGEMQRSLQYRPGGDRQLPQVPYGYWWEAVCYCVPEWFVTRSQIPCYLQSFLCPRALAVLCYFCGTKLTRPDQRKSARGVHGRVELCVNTPVGCKNTCMPACCDGCAKPSENFSRIGLKKAKLPSPQYVLTQLGLHVSTHQWQDLDVPKSQERMQKMWDTQGGREHQWCGWRRLARACSPCTWLARSFRWRSIVQLDLTHAWKQYRRMFTFKFSDGVKPYDFDRAGGGSGGKVAPEMKGHATTPYDLHLMEELAQQRSKKIQQVKLLAQKRGKKNSQLLESTKEQLAHQRLKSGIGFENVGFEAASVTHGFFIRAQDIVRVSATNIAAAPMAAKNDDDEDDDYDCFEKCQTSKLCAWRQQASLLECCNGRWGHNNYREVGSQDIDWLPTRYKNPVGRLLKMATMRPELWFGQYYLKAGARDAKEKQNLETVTVTYKTYQKVDADSKHRDALLDTIDLTVTTCLLSAAYECHMRLATNSPQRLTVTSPPHLLLVLHRTCSVLC
jgi:hypothetical protein